MSIQPHEKIFYVYQHKRLTDDSVFYIGKGKLKRAWSKSGRSGHWRNIVKKHGYYVEIIKKEMTESDAFEFEEKLIRRMKKHLCNKTCGGEGPSGMVHTKETREKFRAAKLGKKQMPEHAKKSASARVGKRNSKEHIEATTSKKRKPVINSSGEIYCSASEASRKTGISQGTISMCCRGERITAGGMSWSYNTSKTPSARSHKRKSPILCATNGMEFKSIADAARWLKSTGVNAVGETIRRAAHLNKKAYKYEWRMASR